MVMNRLPKHLPLVHDISTLILVMLSHVMYSFCTCHWLEKHVRRLEYQYKYDE